LNFSPPYPQKGYESRRLTSDWFINGYKEFLAYGGAVYQKTDDAEFFEYSFAQFDLHGFSITDISADIESGNIPNIMTEYESKFRKLGMKVYALKAVKV
jgi:tRNA (guanine-N7-)-methyltransferase